MESAGEVENKIKLPSKMRKKLSRAKAKLQKDGFEFSETTTSTVVISNGGLANGVKRTDLESVIDNFTELEMRPEKSYAIASFGDHLSAENTVEKLQGHVLKCVDNLASPSPILYMHYVKHTLGGKSSMATSMDYRNVPGLILCEDFISKNEEDKLIRFLEHENPVTNSVEFKDNTLKHREVWHYGYEFRYKYNDVDPNKPLKSEIPDILNTLITKIMKSGHLSQNPNQITINKYSPGQGIPPHIDNAKAFDEALASLSLGSQTMMDFKKSGSHVQVLLKPCSLVVFTGESRYLWTHGISPRKVDLIPMNEDAQNLNPVNRGIRYSITFRRVRDDYKGPGGDRPVASHPMNEVEAASLEQLHVHKVYNEIASHFTSTRDKPWPKVKQFIDSLEPHSIVLDVGCGSGRYLGVRDDVQMIGCDRSKNLIGICKEKGHEVFTCDGLSLPLRGGVFDACICIAVIHHYSTLDRRLKAVGELLKMTKEGGKILISVWALEQEYKRVKSKYLKKIGDVENQTPDPAVTNADKPHTEAINIYSYVEPGSESSSGTKSSPSKDCLPVHKNRTPFQKQDVLVPWHKREPTTAKTESNDLSPKSQTFHRYYHVFKSGELVELCQSFDNVEILDTYYDEGNWCIILKKLLTA